MLAPGSQLALALPAAVATGCAVVFAGLIARELGCDRRAQVFTAVAQATGLWVTLAGHWLTPYSLEPAQWLLLVWLLIRWVRLRDDWLLLALGVVAGLAAMTKFQVLLLLCRYCSPRRPWSDRVTCLRRSMLWVGVVIAAAIAARTLVWQQVHGWPQLRMAPVVAGEAEALYGGRPGIAVQLILFAGVLGVALLGYGLWRLFRDDELREFRFIAVAFVVLYVIFVAHRGPSLLPCRPVRAAVRGRSARAAATPRSGPPSTMAGLVAVAFSAALAVGALVLSVSLTRSDVGEQIARRTADAYHALPLDQQDRTAIVGESFIVAAYLDGYSDRYRLPEAYSLSRSYGYFAPPPAERDTVLYVGRDPRPASALLRHVAEGGRYRRRHARVHADRTTAAVG